MAERRSAQFRILKNIIKQMVDYFSQSGFSCDIIGEDVTLRDLRARRLLGKGKVRRMRIVYGDTHQRDLPASGDGISVLLSLGKILEEERKTLTTGGVMWIEIARKEQSEYSNPLGDEVSLYLRRYGVRTVRV
jgi:hypothetical protein